MSRLPTDPDYLLRHGNSSMSPPLQQATIAQALQQTRPDIAATDARMLLQSVLNVNHAHLIAHSSQELAPKQAQQFYSLVVRRAAGEPVAYLVGEREFYSLNFKVTPAVLIPRPETELLVDLALERISADRPCKVLDLGTGSGAVAITIAKHRPLASITAVDSSVDAIAVARVNTRYLDATNVRMVVGDWFTGIAGEEFDLIVSNPPYVADGDPHLDQSDLRFEPRTALTAGSDGLSCIRCIVTSAVVHLIAGGWLLLEHGYDQAEACRQLLSKAGFVDVLSCPDLAGVMRVSGGKRGNFPAQSC
ncbi:MAG: peptide chain release factor N(5)-glutamine methyltransferase [Nitrosomonadaceae bacterium]|nr:peptide chain release factor N(5)-glutamine methyltransferase [Nitrosomonadaceae bacterium]